jgi:molybdate transport system ATP-binding protein
MVSEVQVGQPRPFVSLQDVVLRPWGNGSPAPIRWEIRSDEHWAVVGPNGCGKSTLARALSGRAPVAGGRVVCHFSGNGSGRGSPPQDQIAYVDFQAQKALRGWPSPFYQARWNSLSSQDTPFVAEVLSEGAVLGLNPYQVVEAAPDPAEFLARRDRVAGLLGIESLLDRRIVHISSGERRKVLMARALLRKPRLLILDNPFAGLDQGFRAVWRELIGTLMQGELRLMVVTTTWEDVLPGITHVLLMEKGEVVAQGPRGMVAGFAHEEPVILNGAQRSEESRVGQGEILRFSQDDEREGREHRVLVQMEGVTVSYDGVQVLREVDWTLRQGEHWALLGPNGAGKTTLLSLILGDNPQAYANNITLFGRRRGSGESIWDLKKQAGWVAPELQLAYPRGTPCLDVVCSGFFDSVGLYQRCSPEQRETARRWMGHLGTAQCAGQAFDAISEGEQRLVLLARAVVKHPALLVLDEPCQGLDADHRDRVLQTVDALSAGSEASVIYVSHDPEALPGCISHVLRLEEGRVVARGRAAAGRR